MVCILGQGLAGTALAFRFEEAQIPFKIIDDGFKSSSSMVAAGLWNPIVFRRINASYLVDELLAEQVKFYLSLEEKLGVDFYCPLPLARVHKTKWEYDTWFEKKGLPKYRDYLTDTIPSWEDEKYTEMPHKAHLVNRAGHLETRVYLQAAQAYFLKSNILLKADVTLPDTEQELLNSSISGMSFDQIIDCRGYTSAYSKWWDYLPFGLTKGETLTVECPGLDLEYIYNSGFFILPLGNNRYRVGATFDWDNPKPETTDAAKELLAGHFSKAVRLPFKIVDQQAGVRPTVQDRRPLIGRHPAVSNLFLFNGMGAKGVMMTPYFSKLFTASLFGKGELPAEVDIARYSKFWGGHNPEINHPVR